MKGNIGKRITYSLLVICMAISMVWNSMPSAIAASSSTLGTPEALGSPLLNGNFSSESWDKWEMVVYGIYLSNFCIPLVDSYESALTTNASYGSQGSGLAALKIGSGNSSDSNSIIEELTTQAIDFQVQTSATQLYVAYTKIENGELGDKTDPNNDGTIRVARFSDLFLLTEKPEDSEGDGTEEKSWANSVHTNVFKSATSAFGGDYVLNEVDNANLPTFYIKSGDKYIEVFDYTNAWDIQVIGSMVNRALESGYKNEFYDNYAKMYSSDKYGNDGVSLGFDSFGNIVSNIDGKNIVVIPASANQHLTESKQINLLNSWIVNGSLRSVTGEIVKNGKQALSKDEHKFNWSFTGFFNDCNYSGGGISAFGFKDQSLIKDHTGEQEDGTVVIFKDSDSLYKQGKTDANSLIGIMENESLLPLKVEMVSAESLECDGDTVGNYAMKNTVVLSSTLCNQVDTNQTVGMDSILFPSGSSADIFTDTVIVANQSSVDADDTSKASITRQIYNFMYSVYKNGVIETTAGKIDKETIVQMLKDVDSESELRDVCEKVWIYYKAYNSEMKDVEYEPGNKFSNYMGDRFTIVQIPSNELSEVARLFSGEDGDFSTYAAYVYVTYLRFYGINSSSVLGEAGGNTTKLNKELFNNSAAKDFSVDNMSGIVSQEQKEEEVLNLSYLMLSDSDEGKEYRNSISKSNLTSFINNQYEAIVSGTSDGSSNNIGKAGFLTIQSLEENPFTSFIIEKYSDIVIVVLTVVVIAIIIAGLLMSKKMAWYFITTVVYVNLVLILPSIGNISSTISNRINNELFKNKTTFWAISQQIEDREEIDKVKDSDEMKLMSELLDGIVLTSSDRTLMLKKDISSKVTTKLSSDYKEAIQLYSTRWIIPIVMQQITAEGEDVNNYTYVSMINTMDDASNVYMYFNEDYKDSIDMLSSDTVTSDEVSDIKVNNRRNKYYEDYYDTSNMTNHNGVNYRHIGYYESNYNEMSHTYFYLLKAYGHESTPLCISSDGIVDYTNVDSYDKYIEKASVSNIQAWETTAEHIQNVSDEYVRNDLETVDNSFGYLLNTESVYNYMYQTVEDSFPSTESLGSLIGKIQGQYKDDSNGEAQRDNFMYATSTNSLYTGDTRDILDLQEFFTNCLPYTYKMWVSAGGFDGKSGVLGDSKIGEHTYYEGSNQSWVFRSNWAIKLMENSDLNSSSTVRDNAGNTYTVDNMLMPECYPSNRPMVFSRAQQNAYGLDDSDLSYVELKCVKVNEDTAIQWSSLLNYAGTQNITKEIILRQMAMEATTAFNNGFTTQTIVSNRYDLNPQTLDLRSLSFDSIMKMIILNITKDSSYIYGNTAEALISKVDIITSAILLITAMICTYIIPLIRNIMAVVILVLSMYAAIKSLVSDNRFKSKVIAGALLTQVEITLVNIAYYSIFSLFISLTGDDELLSVDRVNASISSGNPVWALAIILVISIIYIAVMCIMIWNFIQNRNDMGFERYFAIMSSIGSKMSNKIESAVNSLSSAFGGDTYNNTTYKYNDTGRMTGNSEDKATSVKIDNNRDVAVSIVDDTENASVDENKDIEVSIYDDNVEIDVTNERNRIDEEINRVR